MANAKPALSRNFLGLLNLAEVLQGFNFFQHRNMDESHRIDGLNEQEPDLPPSWLNKKITDLQITHSELVASELVASELVASELVGTDTDPAVLAYRAFDHGADGTVQSPIPARMENLAAVGGAVGSVIVGVWGLGVLVFTSWSFINGLLGLPLAIWGLSSSKRKLAVLGIWLSWLTMLLSLFRLNF